MVSHAVCGISRSFVAFACTLRIDTCDQSVNGGACFMNLILSYSFR